jgi:zinc transporter ZupT
MTADTSDAARSQHQHHHHHGSRHHNGSSEDADDEQESPVAVNESSATLRNRRKRTGVSNAGATASAQPLVDSKVDNSLGWMTLVTSMVHTATDGLTLAITYHLRPNPATVYAAAFAVLLHEIPHGLANYAILLQAGFSPSKAVLMQLLTGVGTFVGALSAKLTVPEGDMALANQVSFNGTTSKVMAIVTGGLLYTAMCGLLPQVMNSANGSSLAAFSIRLLLIFAGIYLMALIGEFE